MKIIDKLERSLGRIAVPHLTLTLAIGQVLVYVLLQMDNRFIEAIVMVPALVLQGEFWRPFTFIFDPPDTNPIFFAFAIYIFYMMGTALEHEWGDFRYNLFLLLGWLATVAASFLYPNAVASPTFIAGSIFLAFAFLFPNFTLMLFFILPVKIKWLALITWIFYGFAVISGSWQDRVLIIAGLLNFFVFFGVPIWRRARSGQRGMTWDFRTTGRQMDVQHKCVICGRSEVSNPELEFRYCSKCAGSPCYCAEHAQNHEHRA